MAEIPDNVDFSWLARHLVEFREETRADLAHIRDDLGVIVWSAMRTERAVTALREEVQRLWLAHGDLRRRLERLDEIGR